MLFNHKKIKIKQLYNILNQLVVYKFKKIQKKYILFVLKMSFIFYIYIYIYLSKKKKKN